MRHNTSGGGAKTNKNGKKFEKLTYLEDILSKNGYDVYNNGKVFKNNEYQGIVASQSNIYPRIFEIKYKDAYEYVSKRLKPDDAFYNIHNKTLYIIEKKFQETEGSVDEKLQTCVFKQ